MLVISNSSRPSGEFLREPARVGTNALPKISGPTEPYQIPCPQAGRGWAEVMIRIPQTNDKLHTKTDDADAPLVVRNCLRMPVVPLENCMKARVSGEVFGS